MQGHVADLQGLRDLIDKHSGQALLVHHFATWCDPCEEELPGLGRTLRSLDSLPIRRVAVAWDLFMTPVQPEEALRVCTGFLERLEAEFDDLVVYTGTPDELFADREMDDGTVPLTDLHDPSGKRVERWPEPLLEASELDALAAACRSAVGV